MVVSRRRRFALRGESGVSIKAEWSLIEGTRERCIHPRPTLDDDHLFRKHGHKSLGDPEGTWTRTTSPTPASPRRGYDGDHL